MCVIPSFKIFKTICIYGRVSGMVSPVSRKGTGVFGGTRWESSFVTRQKVGMLNRNEREVGSLYFCFFKVIFFVHIPTIMVVKSIIKVSPLLDSQIVILLVINVRPYRHITL